MQMWRKSAWLPVALAVGLSACSGGGAPQVAKVVLTAPSDLNVKIDAPVAFGAAAQDSGGQPVAGQVITWASTDPAVATVEQTGEVTARHLGTFKVTATASNVTATSDTYTTYGLDVSAGTIVFAGNPQAESFFVFSLRDAVGTFPTTAQVVSVTGPGTWNGSAPLTVNAPSLDKYAGGFNIPAASGVYTARATVDGVDYSNTFSVDPGITLPPPTGLASSGLTSSQVTVSWTAVSGANHYDVLLFPQAGGALIKAVSTASTSATLSGLSLASGTSYTAYVRAVSAGLDFPLPLPDRTTASRADLTIVGP
ncbi:MAG TPA: Ig-like domain-containing protein [Deinococcales bacterium]|nr:Ig-like domain-containing protein [Deinococcales bacterium]